MARKRSGTGAAARAAGRAMEALGLSQRLPDTAIPVNPSILGRYRYIVEETLTHTSTGQTVTRRVVVNSNESLTLADLSAEATLALSGLRTVSPPLAGALWDWTIDPTGESILYVERRS